MAPSIDAGPLASRPVVQIAYAVDDVHAAATRWAALTGAGPFFVREHVPIERAEHRGDAAVFDHSTAVGQWGEVMLELVEHHELAPHGLARALRPRGTGINHVAWFVDDLDAERARLVASGASEVMTAETAQVRFAFFDLGPEVGHLVECYEPNPYLTELYDRVRAAAEGWDGRDPIRSREQLQIGR